jgi:hypothetical protein
MGLQPARPDRVRTPLVVLGLTVLALALRLYGRGHESIWYDEAFSLEMARADYADLLTGRPPGRDPGNPAGYFLLLRAWLELFGSASIETARALSALAGALAVPAVWLLARFAGASRRTELLACLLVSVSPPLVYLGQEARAFALLATLATLAVAAAVAIERTDRPGAWVGFTAVGAVLVHVHYYAFFVLLTLGLDLLAWAWRRGWPALVKLGAASAAVAGAFAPWLPVFRWQLTQGANRSAETWWQQLALLPSFSLVGRTLAWKPEGVRWVVALDLFVCVAVFAPLAWLLLRQRTWPRLLASYVLGLPLLVGLVALAAPMVHTHYLSVLVPTVLLLVAWGLAGWQRRGRLATAVALVVAGLMAASLQRLYTIRHKTDWRALTTLVGRDGPDLPVYFYEDLGSLPFAYYRPDHPPRRLLEPPGPHGDGWRRPARISLDDQPAVLSSRSYLARMHGERDGFWFVFYATSSASRAAEPVIVKVLGEEFVLSLERRFGQLLLLRCRPRHSPLSSARCRKRFRRRTWARSSPSGALSSSQSMSASAPLRSPVR